MPLTAEQIEKSRAEFEVWIVSEAKRRNYAYMREVLIRFQGDDSYVTTWVDTGWMAWLARQETLCVELPDKVRDGYGRNVFSSVKIIEAIEAAGIAHK